MALRRRNRAPCRMRTCSSTSSSATQVVFSFLFLGFCHFFRFWVVLVMVLWSLRGLGLGLWEEFLLGGGGLIVFSVGGCRRGEVVPAVAIHGQEVSARA